MFETTPLTVGDLRKAIVKLSDEHPIIVEDFEVKWDIVKAFAVGIATHDPGLVIHIRRHEPDE